MRSAVATLVGALAAGAVRTPACGMPDGAIGIFEVAATQLSAAEALSFALLSTLPRASRVACR
jgi:hypothetical protein